MARISKYSPHSGYFGGRLCDKEKCKAGAFIFPYRGPRSGREPEGLKGGPPRTIDRRRHLDIAQSIQRPKYNFFPCINLLNSRKLYHRQPEGNSLQLASSPCRKRNTPIAYHLSRDFV
jgi:hypothetical protein